MRSRLDEDKVLGAECERNLLYHANHFCTECDAQIQMFLFRVTGVEESADVKRSVTLQLPNAVVVAADIGL